jgi:hypothetical protein
LTSDGFDALQLGVIKPERALGSSVSARLVALLDERLREELDLMAARLGISVHWAYFREEEGENAYATTRVPSGAGARDGSVYFGMNLLEDALTYDGGDYAIVGFFAHEFAHILQFRHQLTASLCAGQQTVRRLELHADFVAGFLLGDLKWMPRHKIAKLGAFDLLIQYLGDHNLRDADHHGTPRERRQAVELGYRLARSREAIPISEMLAASQSAFKF